MADSRTYRFRQLPPHADDRRLPTLLLSIDSALGPLENIQIHSLAPSLDPWESPPTKTATITFKRVPSVFDNEKTEWVFLANDTGLLYNVIVDVHFLGFTPLNDVVQGHCLDCIAISGLASHPFGSWKHREQKSFMWLRDAFPFNLKYTRSIIYGYDTTLVTSESFQTVEDIALSFIARLKSIGRSSLSAKPVVFIAHSLGGIILKRALLEMANSGTAVNFMLQGVRGIFLFGVPNRGMMMSHLLLMVQGKPNEDLIKILSPESSYLSDLDDQFSGIALQRKIRIISIYETKLSQIPRWNPESGCWERDGPHERLVEKASAIHRDSLASDIIPIDADHSTMVKFAEDSPDYRVIVTSLQEMQESALRLPLAAERSNLKCGRQGSVSADLDTYFMLDQDYSETTDSSQYIPTGEDMLKSLWFEEINLRSQEIDQSYEKTFEWVWTKPSLGFRSWLEGDEVLFWISGKPGSGKSTFMKYIYNDIRTVAVLNQKSDYRRQHAAFFFHDRGSNAQKSFEGLLRSIIHKLLSSDKYLLNYTLPSYQKWKPDRQINWSLKDLRATFSSLLVLQRQVEIYLFLDALDEYDGPPEMIANFIKSTVDLPAVGTKVKICFSSRPWNIFSDNFEHVPGFKIHQETEHDVWRYMRGRFLENKSTSLLLHSNRENEQTEVAALMKEISKRAEGVFLWLKLVLNDLIQAYSDGSTITELSSILVAFPEKLEDLYTRLILKIPQRFRQEAYMMLEILLRSFERMSLQDFWNSLRCAPLQNLDACIEIVQEESFAQLQRRLKSRCGGLLEIVGNSNPTVQFMHQTVKDFVSRPGFHNLIVGQDGSLPEENGYSFLAKWSLAQLCQFHDSAINSIERSNTKTYMIMHRVGFYTHQAELSLGKSQKTFLDQVKSAVFHRIRLLVTDCLSFDSILSFAVVANLPIYVRETLLGSHINPRTITSLMYLVINATIVRDIAKDGTAGFSGPIMGPIMSFRSSMAFTRSLEDIFRFLFEISTQKNAHLQDGKLFGELFLRNFESRRIVGINFMGESMIEIARQFLRNGQNPNIDIKVMGLRPNIVTTCQPLHVAFTKMARLLLEHGANVNSLDSNGRTPLDNYVWFCISSISFSPVPAIEALNTVILLLDYGACVTWEGNRLMLHLISKFQSLHVCVPERVRKPPLLEQSHLHE